MELIGIRTGQGIKSKYPAIKKELQTRIVNGEYGDRLPSLRAMSSEFSSNVITINKAVDALVTEGVLERKLRRGIFVKDLTPVATRSIGVVGNPTEEEFFLPGDYSTPLIRGLNVVLHNEKAIFSYQTREPSVLYRRLFRNLTMVDGLLVCLPHLAYTKELIRLGRTGFPLVVIGSSFPEPEINYVDSSDYADSFTAVERLIKTGHRRIALLTESMERKLDPVMRAEGYRRALEKHGLKVNPALMWDAAGEPLEKLLAPAAKHTAVFAAFQKPLLQYLTVFTRKRTAVQGGPAIVAYDDFRGEVSRFGYPCTVIEQPWEEMGRIAAEKLLALIAGEETGPVKINLRSAMVEKNSLTRRVS